MDSTTFVVLSGALSFGVPLLWGVGELRSLRRDRGGNGWSGGWDRGRVPVPPRPRGGEREQPRPLPACLIEAARGAPPGSRVATRELEDA